MLKVISLMGNFLLDIDDYSIHQKYGGLDVLNFSISTEHPYYQYILEEVQIIDLEDEQSYIIKAIDEGNGRATVRADLDLDEFKMDWYPEYKAESCTVQEMIEQILPSGWILSDHSYRIGSENIVAENKHTLDLLLMITDLYKVVCKFEHKNKTIHLYNPQSEKHGGAYLTDSLNLKEINLKGTSNSFVTRLYVRGKDGLTFAEINQGKDYIDDNTYSNKIIVSYWNDNEIDDPNKLLEQAKQVLSQCCVPHRSYECSIVDLAKARENFSGADNNIYSFLDFQMYQQIMLLDSKRKIRTAHRIVEMKRYPHYPQKNEITLSTSPVSIQNSVQKITNQLNQKHSVFWKEIGYAVDHATQKITGAKGGYVVLESGEDGKTAEILIMDTPDKATAKNIWRWNSGGLGFSNTEYNGDYGIAMTEDGKINANFITTGKINGSLIDAENIRVGETSTLGEYIRMGDGEIELGKKDNEFKAKLDHTQLSFLQDNMPVAYISNNKLFITDAEVSNRMTIGKNTSGYFDFVPRSNGNLSLKWRNG